MEICDGATAPNLRWTVYQPDRELSHFLVLPKSTTGLAADALNFSHFDDRVRVTKNLRLLEIAHAFTCLNHTVFAWQKELARRSLRSQLTGPLHHYISLIVGSGSLCADEILTAFLELESVVQEFGLTGTLTTSGTSVSAINLSGSVEEIVCSRCLTIIFRALSSAGILTSG
jgi:hypothetical protein